LLNDFDRFFFKNPFNQMIDIPKVIIKGLPVYTAVLNDFPNCDFIQGLFFYNFFSDAAMAFLSLK